MPFYPGDASVQVAGMHAARLRAGADLTSSYSIAVRRPTALGWRCGGAGANASAPVEHKPLAKPPVANVNWSMDLVHLGSLHKDFCQEIENR